MSIKELNDSYYFQVLKSLLGHLPKARQTNDIQELVEILKEEAEKSIKEDIRASILPTSVSKKEGRNFYLPKEKLLTEEEVNELIDDLAGVFLKEGRNVYVFKIKNNEIFKEYAKGIKKEGFKEGINKLSLFKKVGIQKSLKISEEYSNIALFLLLNHFILYLISKIPKENWLREILEFSYATGVFTVISKEKKRKYYITNLSEFISKFYGTDFGKEYSTIGFFLFSFYITDKDFKDKALGLLDKLLYYLIFKHQINWKILCDLLVVFHSFNYKKYIKENKKPLKIKSAQEFFRMMNLENIYSWAYAIGKAILDKDKENGSKYINEIIKEIEKEELPGKFKEELSKVIYKISEKIRKNTGDFSFSLSIHPDVAKKDLQGDEFYKVKAAILSGLINSLS